jgi:hypothetical protein
MRVPSRTCPLQGTSGWEHSWDLLLWSQESYRCLCKRESPRAVHELRAGEPVLRWPFEPLPTSQSFVCMDPISFTNYNNALWVEECSEISYTTSSCQISHPSPSFKDHPGFSSQPINCPLNKDQASVPSCQSPLLSFIKFLLEYVV